MRVIVLALAATFLMTAGTLTAQAHHSFAVHYIPDKEIDVTGVVTNFHFANPHGVIFFNTVGEDGETIAWKGETNSPNLLKRRGWTNKSLQPGDKITIHGWPARDGKPMLRVGYVQKADGTILRGQSSAEGIKGLD